MPIVLCKFMRIDSDENKKALFGLFLRILKNTLKNMFPLDKKKSICFEKYVFFNDTRSSLVLLYMQSDVILIFPINFAI